MNIIYQQSVMSELVLIYRSAGSEGTGTVDHQFGKYVALYEGETSNQSCVVWSLLGIALTRKTDFLFACYQLSKKGAQSEAE